MMYPAVTFHQSDPTEVPITVPAIGLDLRVRLSDGETGGACTIIETANAPGFGPPLHRHREAEIFRVLEGSYLYEVDGRRFSAEAGDLVSVPGGASHAFVNLTERIARQLVIILPGLDARAFFEELAMVMTRGAPDETKLEEFGRRWNVEFLGPPLKPDEA